jgi:cytochrome c peroxidase
VWLDGVPALRIPAPDARAAAQGATLFESSELGCSECHSGAKLTNQQRVDVGTGGTFEVPSLQGLLLRPPYMHDGCATQLKDCFTAPCGGSPHARAAQVTADEQSALLAYLMQL